MRLDGVAVAVLTAVLLAESIPRCRAACAGSVAFVSTSGSDAANGTSVAPLASLVYALGSECSSASSVILLDGTHVVDAAVQLPARLISLAGSGSTTLQGARLAAWSDVAIADLTLSSSLIVAFNASLVSVSSLSAQGNCSAPVLAAHGAGTHVNATDLELQSCDAPQDDVALVHVVGGAELTLSQAVITGTRGGAGRGIRAEGAASKVTVTGCEVRSNDGGGIMISGGNITIADSVISGNACAGDGAGVLVTGASVHVLLRDSELHDNRATGSGAALAVDAAGAAVVVSNTTFVRNHALTGDGGGIWIADGASASLTDVTISACTAEQGSGGAAAVQADAVLVRNSRADNCRSLSATLALAATSLDVWDCDVRNCRTATYAGALLANATSSAEIHRSVFDGNQVTAGDATVAVVGSGVLNCTATQFLANAVAGDAAGVLVATSGSATLADILAVGNEAHGGAAAFSVASPATSAVLRASELRDCLATDGAAVDVSAPGVTLELVDVRVTGTAALVQTQRRGGAALSVRGDGAAVELVDCVLANNTLRVSESATSASLGGGALACAAANATVLVRSSVLQDNTVELGGVLAGAGGAVSVWDTCAVTLNATQITGNTARSGGAVAAHENAVVTADSCQLHDNTAISSGGGGAILTTSRVAVSLVACSVAGNAAPNGGGGFELCVGRQARATVADADTQIGNNTALFGSLRATEPRVLMPDHETSAETPVDAVLPTLSFRLLDAYQQVVASDSETRVQLQALRGQVRGDALVAPVDAGRVSLAQVRIAHPPGTERAVVRASVLGSPGIIASDDGASGVSATSVTHVTHRYTMLGCDGGQRLHADELVCVSCAIGEFAIGGAQCTECPDHATCTGVGAPQADAGYHFLTSAKDVGDGGAVLLSCPNYMCAAGNQCTDTLHTGPLCGSCEGDTQRWRDQCVACTSLSTSPARLGPWIALAAFLLLAGVAVARQGRGIPHHPLVWKGRVVPGRQAGLWALVVWSVQSIAVITATSPAASGIAAPLQLAVFDLDFWPGGTPCLMSGLAATHKYLLSILAMAAVLYVSRAVNMLTRQSAWVRRDSDARWLLLVWCPAVYHSSRMLGCRGGDADYSLMAVDTSVECTYAGWHASALAVAVGVLIVAAAYALEMVVPVRDLGPMFVRWWWDLDDGNHDRMLLLQKREIDLARRRVHQVLGSIASLDEAQAGSAGRSSDEETARTDSVVTAGTTERGSDDDDDDDDDGDDDDDQGTAENDHDDGVDDGDDDGDGSDGSEADDGDDDTKGDDDNNEADDEDDKEEDEEEEEEDETGDASETIDGSKRVTPSTGAVPPAPAAAAATPLSVRGVSVGSRDSAESEREPRLLTHMLEVAQDRRRTQDVGDEHMHRDVIQRMAEHELQHAEAVLAHDTAEESWNAGGMLRASYLVFFLSGVFVGFHAWQAFVVAMVYALLLLYQMVTPHQSAVDMTLDPLIGQRIAKLCVQPAAVHEREGAPRDPSQEAA